MDYATRLKTLRSKMAERKVGLVILLPGANLFYLTGIQRQEPGGTDHNAFGDWAAGAYIDANGTITLLVPRMGSKFYENQLADKPWITLFRKVTESHSPFELVCEMLGKYDLAGKKVLLDDRAWAQSVLLFQRLLPTSTFGIASEILSAMRMIKTPEEVALMRHAGEITAQAFESALKRLGPGVTELEISSEVDYQFKTLGAQYTSFVTGIFFGGEAHDRLVNASAREPKRLQHGDSIMFDIGCVYEGYCSDFGRTAFCGDPPVEYLRVQNLVLAAQQAGIEALKANETTGAEVNSIARQIIEDGGYGRYFGHRLGHGIGVTVHEPPWLDSVEHMVLRDNMTFTVEPSVVVPGKFGNRIEDVVRVTPAGGEPLYSTERKLYLID